MFVQLVQLESRLPLAMTHLEPTRNVTPSRAPLTSEWWIMFVQLACLERQELVGMTHPKLVRRARQPLAPPTKEW
jgi:hypothetical protein